MSQPSASQRERRILLIEDDRTLATELRGMLAGHGYVVDHAADGVAGYGLASTGQFSVMIVDRMLPGIDGLTLVKRLRDAGVATPLLFLTAVSRVEERVRGLMAGGDDYLVKPFDTAELVARLDVIQRRNVPAASIVELGPLRLDLLERKASRNGRDLELMPHEFRLLAYLVAHAGTVVSKETLLVEVWNYKFIPDSNVVSVHISNLRHKLEERGGGGGADPHRARPRLRAPCSHLGAPPRRSRSGALARRSRSGALARRRRGWRSTSAWRCCWPPCCRWR